MLTTVRFLVFQLIFEVAVLKVALTSGNQNGQEILRKLLAEEVTKALYNFTCDSPSLNNIEERVDGIAQSVAEMSSLLAAFNDSLQKQIDAHDDAYGLKRSRAADNCTQIFAGQANSSSGYYWVKSVTGHPHRVYCDMTRSCGGVTGGWMRVAYLDMTNTSQKCPNGLRQRKEYYGKKGCAPHSYYATCASVLYQVNDMKYSRVCGSIQGYRISTADGFYRRGPNPNLTLDSNYVDGVSLTHGMSPRHHIWTFAAKYSCPCGSPPAFINKNEYFCGTHWPHRPLWDNTVCNGRCCYINNPPWFYKRLPRPTTDNIEMRLCRDQERGDEDILVAKVEIYVL